MTCLRITYTSDTDSLSFWPIYHRQSMVSVSAECWPLYQPRYLPIVGRYLGWYIGWYGDWHISVVISAESRLICWPIHRSSVSWDVVRYISRVSVEMSTDVSVEGCTKYTWSDPSKGCLRSSKILANYLLHCLQSFKENYVVSQRTVYNDIQRMCRHKNHIKFNCHNMTPHIYQYVFTAWIPVTNYHCLDTLGTL